MCVGREVRKELHDALIRWPFWSSNYGVDIIFRNEIRTGGVGTTKSQDQDVRLDRKTLFDPNECLLQVIRATVALIIRF